MKASDLAMIKKLIENETDMGTLYKIESIPSKNAEPIKQ